ncbi:MAG: hypothetical protein WDM81_14930 [Rhizomicrobium sp.]
MPQPISTPTAAGTIAAGGGNDRADGRAHAPMHVRHDRDVVMDEGQRRDVQKLRLRGVLEGHASIHALMGAPFS